MEFKWIEGMVSASLQNIHRWFFIQRAFRRAGPTIAALTVAATCLNPTLGRAEFTYTLDADSATLTGYSGDSGLLFVPNYFEGRPLTSIGANAFAGNLFVRAVYLPDSVVSIGDSAFSNCPELTGVFLGDEVAQIGAFAFSESPLSSIILPDSVLTVGEGAFQDCRQLQTLSIGAGVEHIAVGAFKGCIGLTEIEVAEDNAHFTVQDGVFLNKELTRLIRCPRSKTGEYVLPASVRTIEDHGFYLCLGLTNIVLNEGLESIGNDAFGNCQNLAALRIPASVNHIGTAPISLAYNLVDLEVDDENAHFSSLDNVLFNKEKTVLIQCPPTTVGEYIMPDSVIEIRPWAFWDCASISGITMGENVQVIGPYAFDTTTFRDIVLPESLLTIGDYAFVSSRLETLTIPDSVSSIGDHAFFFCVELKSVVIGDGVTTIGAHAFHECTGLESLTIGSHVELIGADAFNGCRSLTRVHIPDSVVEIGERAFTRCFQLQSVTIGRGITELQDAIFFNCNNLSGVYFAGNAPEPGDSVFPEVEGLTVYHLPSGTGWGETFAGLPVVPWDPQFAVAGPDFGVQEGRFGFTITGADGLVVVVEACPDLANNEWQHVATVTLTGGSAYFGDTDWNGFQHRYYRFRSP